MKKLATKLTHLIAALAVAFSLASPALVAGPVYAQSVNFNPGTNNDNCEDPNPDSNNCGIIRYLLIFINGLSAIVGVTIVAVIVMAGIKYASSADDPNAVADAKNRIKNAIFALVMYIFMFAFLQWIVPGGVL